MNELIIVVFCVFIKNKINVFKDYKKYLSSDKYNFKNLKEILK